jgi:hypothetical protein
MYLNTVSWRLKYIGVTRARQPHRFYSTLYTGFSTVLLVPPEQESGMLHKVLYLEVKHC